MRRLWCGYRLPIGANPPDRLVVMWWMLWLVEMVLVRDIVVHVMMMVEEVARED